MSDEVLSQEEIEALISQTAEGKSDVTAVSASSDEVDDEAQQSVQNGDVSNTTPPGFVIETSHEDSHDVAVRPAEFNPLNFSTGAAPHSNGVDLILDVQVQVAVELGRARLQVRDVLALGPGSVVELDKHAGEPVEVVVNNKTIARGEVVVIDENFGVRITEIINSSEREIRAKAA